MKTSPKDFFLHLGAMVALYVGAGSLINLILTIVDAVFPNVLFNYGNYYNYSPISTSVAVLIIIFPVFVILSWLLNKDYRTTPEKRTLGIRKWLIYITLFVSGALVAGDLIYLIYTFLSGEIIRAGFIIKVVAVFIVAGSIFAYYISSLRDAFRGGRDKVYAIITAVVILALIIWGFSIFGLPSTQRMYRFDSQKVNDLQSIQYQIVNYWQQKQILPENLGNLSDSISGFAAPKDMDSGKDYEYRKLGDMKFELCADFNLASNDRSSGMTYPTKPMMGPLGPEENWNHGAGRTCFDRTIDPDLYPPALRI